MKSVVYKNPVISSLITNIFALIIAIYIVKERKPELSSFLMIFGVINGQIIKNGEEITIKKKIIIYISFCLMILFLCGILIT